MSDTIRLNDVKDVMDRLRLGRSKIYEEMEVGRLRSVKVGSRRLIPESAIVDYIQSLIDSTSMGDGADATTSASAVSVLETTA